MPEPPPFLRSIALADDAPPTGYPFDLPAVQALGQPLKLAPVTILSGDNGSGKSTIVEAIAVAVGFNPEGGSRHLHFRTHDTHSSLGDHVRIGWAARPQWGWFLRAETFYGMASRIADDRDHGVAATFPDLHARSHGESFLALIEHRFGGAGLYVLDEPESALSFQGQLGLVRFVHDAVATGSQFVIATHSPLLMCIPHALLYVVDDDGLTPTAYDDVPVVELWRRFLAAPDRFLDRLLADD